MSSARDFWKSPAWPFQSKDDAIYDLFSAGALSAEIRNILGDAGTNAVVDVLNIGHTSSGTPAAGFGVGLTFDLEDASGNGAQEAASIDVAWTTATHGAEAADMIFKVSQGGTVTELARLDAANDQLLVAGKIKATGALEIDGAAQFDGQVTLGDAALDGVILNTRVATGSLAGAAIDLGATYSYSELLELRGTISSWAGIGSSFKGMYLRAQADVDKDGGELMGAQIWGVANGADIDNLVGVQAYAYFKGDTAETSTAGYGVHGELSFDAGRANAVTLTEATPLLGKITAGKVADYTKIHGAILRFGDMDGQARTFGSAILVDDDQAMAGVATLTNIIQANTPAAAFLKVGATGQAGVEVNAAWNTEQAAADLAGTLAIDVGGTTYYINLYTSQPTTI